MTLLRILCTFLVVGLCACADEIANTDAEAAQVTPDETEDPPQQAVQQAKPAATRTAAKPAAAGPLPAPADVAAAPADATVTASGLAYKVITAGTGTEHPLATSKVKVHYTGWTADGKMFDSSVVRGKPTSFPLNRVIKGWTEGLQLMVTGEKTRFWIPGKLAYGDTPKRPGAPSGTLVFDVELFSFEAAP